MSNKSGPSSQVEGEALSFSEFYIHTRLLSSNAWPCCECMFKKKKSIENRRPLCLDLLTRELLRGFSRFWRTWTNPKWGSRWCWRAIQAKERCELIETWNEKPYLVYFTHIFISTWRSKSIVSKSKRDISHLQENKSVEDLIFYQKSYSNIVGCLTVIIQICVKNFKQIIFFFQNLIHQIAVWLISPWAGLFIIDTQDNTDKKAIYEFPSYDRITYVRNSITWNEY